MGLTEWSEHFIHVDAWLGTAVCWNPGPNRNWNHKKNLSWKIQNGKIFKDLIVY